jgi:hypothetical protein
MTEPGKTGFLWQLLDPDFEQARRMHDCNSLLDWLEIVFLEALYRKEA